MSPSKYLRVQLPNYSDTIDVYINADNSVEEVWRYLDTSLTDPLIYAKLSDVPEPFKSAVARRLFHSQSNRHGKAKDSNGQS